MTQLALRGIRLLLSTFVCAASVFAADTASIPAMFGHAADRPAYYWTETPVSGGAELVTLFGRFGPDSAGEARTDVPLVAVLRDSLANEPVRSLTYDQQAGKRQLDDSSDDRLRYVWLLTSDKPSLARRMLSGVPFFYWKVGRGESQTGEQPTMLVDMSQPEHRVWRTAGRDILQWTAFDPLATPVRASTRAYRTNSGEEERVHLEEAIALLRRAPANGDGLGLTTGQIDSVIARLRLTQNLMGGLVKDSKLKGVEESRDAERQSTIGRNWELLRTSAERTGLLFEPLRLGSSGEDYAVLWFPLNTHFAEAGVSLDSTWKLLHISDPWDDSRLKTWTGYVQSRWLDSTGKLLAPGVTGTIQISVAPLAVYSLAYPRSPLLLVDFRDRQRAQRRDVIQKATDEIVNGVLGLSHFTNWYYYAGNGLYQFVKSRRGAAVNAGARLDSYAEFRVAAALDSSMEPEFRKELQRRTDGLSANPLEVSLTQQLSAARHNYQQLLADARNPEKLPKKLDNDRRAELASYGKSNGSRIRADAFHYLTFTAYTRRAPKRDDDLARLSRDRTVQSLIQYLTQVANSGPEPEVTHDPARIRQSILKLGNLVDARSPTLIRKQAAAALERVGTASKDPDLRADCNRAVMAFNAGTTIELPSLSSGRTWASSMTFDVAPVLRAK
jgi:hypothetical protein